ncbi:hypothetical protein J7L84_00565 [Candidatus Bipolaricaulota bacterium]|nr:hypothetical protein [Candidatus Bipolaricaulota bacterium]
MGKHRVPLWEIALLTFRQELLAQLQRSRPIMDELAVEIIDQPLDRRLPPLQKGLA